MPVDVLSSAEIDCPREDVAAFAADPDNATAWYQNIKSVEWRTPQPLDLGSQVTFVATFLGRRLAYTYEVVDFVPGSRLVMSTKEAPFPMETTYTWQGTSSGGTYMTLRNRGEPAGFSKVVTPVLESAMRRANAQDLTRLKGILERDTSTVQVEREPVHAELERARRTFHELLSAATREQLRRGTDGTRWTNAQLLFHMVLGYLVVLTLLPLVRMFGRLPEGFSRAFARLLNAGTRPFHVVNYLGACGGALVFRGPRLERRLDRTLAALHRRLAEESDEALARRMHFPVGWDPFFADSMSLLEVYHYGTQHFDFHLRQLTLHDGDG